MVAVTPYRRKGANPYRHWVCACFASELEIKKASKGTRLLRVLMTADTPIIFLFTHSAESEIYVPVLTAHEPNFDRKKAQTRFSCSVSTEFFQ